MVFSDNLNIRYLRNMMEWEKSRDTVIPEYKFYKQVRVGQAGVSVVLCIKEGIESSTVS